MITRKLTHARHARHAARHGETANPTTTLLPSLISVWVNALKARHYSSATIEGYECDVRRYLERDSNPTAISIQTYIAARLDMVSTARVASEVKALKSFYRFLRRSELIADDPTKHIEGFRVNYQERRLPSREDIEKLLAMQFHGRDYTARFRLITTLLANTGARLGEVCAIKVGDINLERLEISVLGKGRKRRVLPISPYVAEMLQTWIGRNGHSEWLFPASNGSGRHGICSFEATFKRACKKVGIEPFTPHALRHFWATYSLRNGAPLQTVSRALGHASVAITIDLYTHITDEELHQCHQFSPFA